MNWTCRAPHFILTGRSSHTIRSKSLTYRTTSPLLPNITFRFAYLLLKISRLPDRSFRVPLVGPLTTYLSSLQGVTSPATGTLICTSPTTISWYVPPPPDDGTYSNSPSRYGPHTWIVVETVSCRRCMGMWKRWVQACSVYSYCVGQGGRSWEWWPDYHCGPGHAITLTPFRFSPLLPTRPSDRVPSHPHPPCQVVGVLALTWPTHQLHQLVAGAPKWIGYSERCRVLRNG
jgi:hypothetical protein